MLRGLRAAALAIPLIAALGTASARAQTPADWWVYVDNDEADKVRAALAQGADPNARARNGQPALMRAVAKDAWRTFDALLADPRTDVNIENPAGETPLMYAALTGQAERAAALIARGAEVNRLGWTPLHYAASKGQMEAARLLLREKAMVNAPSPTGVTPLMMAAYSGSRPMVQLLLDAGADPLTQDLNGLDAADWAEDGKAGELTQALRDLIARRLEQNRLARQRDGNPAGAPAALMPAPALPALAPATSAEVAGSASSGADAVSTEAGRPADDAAGASYVRGLSGVRTGQ